LAAGTILKIPRDFLHWRDEFSANDPGLRVKEAYRRWYTQYLSREFDMLVFGHAGYPVVVFPTSMGRYYQNKDFGLLDTVAPLVDRGLVKIYTPDGIDAESWYNEGLHPADRVRAHRGYENVVLHEVISFARHDTGSPKVALAGCSFGGYHAANISFRSPGLVGYLISMSGAFDIKRFIAGHYDDDCYFNNPPDYLPNVAESEYLEQIRRVGIVLGAGTDDISLDENRRLASILHVKGIPHWLDIRPGVHDWPLWREMFPGYIINLLRQEGITP
jgi:esterase/lipase superfamily enzyme